MIQHLLETDARLSAQLRVAERPGLLRRLAIFLAHSGDSWFWGLGLLAVWVAGDAAWRYRAVLLVFAIAVCAIATQVIKWIVRRERPEGEWGRLYRKADPHSFPSGHASRAIMLSVLGVLLGPLWFALALVIWGPLVALARVAMGVHYLSDILAGAALGLLVGWLSPTLFQFVTPFIPWLL
jgi:undecaprenyl-diphosphatase